MPETVKLVDAPHGLKESWIQVRFRLSMDDWDRVRKQTDPAHIESWLRTSIRKQLDIAET